MGLSNFQSQVSHLRLNMVALPFMGICVSESWVSPQVLKVLSSLLLISVKSRWLLSLPSTVQLEGCIETAVGGPFLLYSYGDVLLSCGD